MELATVAAAVVAQEATMAVVAAAMGLEAVGWAEGRVTAAAMAERAAVRTVEH